MADIISEDFPRVAASKEPRNVSHELGNLERRTIIVTRKVLRETEVFNPDLDLSHQNLEELLNLSSEFFGASNTVTDYLQKEVKAVATELEGIDGFIGVVGLGYPYYALDQEGRPVEVPEISNFINLTRNLVQEDMRYKPEGWACPACQARNKLPDLKTFCKPCDLVILKPRAIFQALPDLDIVVIVNNPVENTESQIEEVINNLGYQQSDVDISGAIRRTKLTIASLKKGEEPQVKLPIDIHIWDRDEIMKCLDLITEGEENTTILTRSLHGNWEDNALNFWFDFIFSFREINIGDTELTNKISDTRASLKKRYGPENIITMLSKISPRASRLLSSASIQDVLRKKVESW